MNANKKAVGVGTAAIVTAIGVAFLSTTSDTIFSNGFDPASSLCGQQSTLDINFLINSRAVVPATSFEYILGKSNAAAIPQLFPGVGVSPVINNMPKSGFIAAKFIVPSTIGGVATGNISNGETYFSAPTTISISPTCGFSVSPPNPRCILNNLNRTQGITWKIEGTSTPGTACLLSPGRTYFLNIKFTTPPTPEYRNNCSLNTCKLPLINAV